MHCDDRGSWINFYWSLVAAQDTAVVSTGRVSYSAPMSVGPCRYLEQKITCIGISGLRYIQSSAINALRNKLRKGQTKDIEKDKYDPKRDGLYKDIFHLCEKLGDHIINVSEAITGERERELKADSEVMS